MTKPFTLYRAARRPVELHRFGRGGHGFNMGQRSLTREAIAARLSRLPKSAGFKLEVEARLESFAALVQVARAGFAHTLVPRASRAISGYPRTSRWRCPG